MTNLDKYKEKGKLLGIEVIGNSWGIAVKDSDSSYKVILEVRGRLVEYRGLFEVNINEYFIIGKVWSANSRRYNYKIFIKGKDKPVLSRNSIMNVWFAGGCDRSMSTVVLADGLSAEYALDYRGRTLKLPEYIHSIKLEKLNNRDVIALYGYIFNSDPCGFIDFESFKLIETNI